MRASAPRTVQSRVAAAAVSGALTVVLVATCPVSQAAPSSEESVQRGEYLARAGNCAGCHTARDGQPFAGGRPIATPIGRIQATNITPDLEAGIGRYSIDDFVKVMREGVAKDGHRLYPAMPYTSYARLSQADLVALYAYFMQGIAPVHVLNRPTKLSWPFSMRSLMALWNALYLRQGEYTADASRSASWNRGAYLVQCLGHCGECHTPRGLAGHLKAYSEQDGRHFLAGATLDNWYASPLMGVETGPQGWSEREIVEFLRTGRTVRVAALGVMAEVVATSTQYLTDEDLMAIADYLKSLPASVAEGQGDEGSTLPASAASAATYALQSGDIGMRGSRVYLDSCSACHGSDGSGANRTFPNLVKAGAVNARDPTTLIHVVLAGSSMPSTHTAPSAFAMPDFGWRLSDTEVADVLSFVRSSWGNHAAAVSHRQVGKIRKALVVQEKAP